MTDAMVYRPTKIAEIKVVEPSLKDDYDPSEDCSTFVVTEKLARLFFRRAEYVSDDGWMEAWEMSSCSARGTVRFANGDGGDWVLDGNGGILALQSGPSRGRVVHLICRRCE